MFQALCPSGSVASFWNTNGAECRPWGTFLVDCTLSVFVIYTVHRLVVVCRRWKSGEAAVQPGPLTPPPPPAPTSDPRVAALAQEVEGGLSDYLAAQRYNTGPNPRGPGEWRRNPERRQDLIPWWYPRPSSTQKRFYVALEDRVAPRGVYVGWDRFLQERPHRIACLYYGTYTLEDAIACFREGNPQENYIPVFF